MQWINGFACCKERIGFHVTRGHYRTIVYKTWRPQLVFSFHTRLCVETHWKVGMLWEFWNSAASTVIPLFLRSKLYFMRTYDNQLDNTPEPCTEKKETIMVDSESYCLVASPKWSLANTCWDATSKWEYSSHVLPSDIQSCFCISISKLKPRNEIHKLYATRPDAKNSLD